MSVLTKLLITAGSLGFLILMAGIYFQDQEIMWRGNALFLTGFSSIIVYYLIRRKLRRQI